MSRKRVSVSDPAPEFVPPCLAKLALVPPDGTDWVHEIKFDGYRLQARLERGTAQLRTRTGLDWSNRFSGLASALKTLNVSSAIVDGEAVVENEAGVSSFPALVDDLKAGRSGRIVLFAFDLLHLNGVDLTGQPLSARKAALVEILQNSSSAGGIRYSQHLKTQGAAMLTEACRLGLEGIISKRIDKPYRSGRHGDWLKVKCVQTDEFVVAGYLESTAMREAVGALVASYYRDGQLIYAGRIGTGFSHQGASDLWKLLQAHRMQKPPFATALTGNQRRGVVWVDPVVVAQVTYRGFTGDHLLRHAAFKAVREDKNPSTVQFPVEP